MSRNEEDLWNKFSSVYDKVMKKDKNAYEHIINLIAGRINEQNEILEIATGTGIISIGLATRGIKFKSIEATDFSKDMISVAKQKADKLGVERINFSVQNAYELDYNSNNFDIVIISNTLHIMPCPEKALKEIKRVLKPNGILFAPNFVHAQNIKAFLLSKIISITGFKAYNKWSEKSYIEFLTTNGFNIIESKLLKASFPISVVIAK